MRLGLKSGRAWLCASGSALAFPLFPALAAAPRLGGGESLNVSLGRMIAAILICIVVALLAALLLRQRGGKINLAALFARMELRPRAIEVVETRRLSPHADICLVRHGGQEYLLLLLAGGARILRERADPTIAGTETSQP